MSFIPAMVVPLPPIVPQQSPVSYYEGPFLNIQEMYSFQDVWQRDVSPTSGPR